MIRAFERQSFGSVFARVMQQKDGQANPSFQEVSAILDMIALCLDFDPFKRPTVSALMNSKLFKQDKFELLSASQFSRNMFF